MRQFRASGLLLVVLFLGMTTALSLPSFAADAGGDAQATLKSAMDAMGGEPLLRSLKSLGLDIRTTQYRVDDSERAGAPPFWVSYQKISEIRDLANGRYHSEIAVENPQFTYSLSTTSDGSINASGVSSRGQTGWRTHPETHERLELAPERVLLTAAAAADLHLLPDVSFHGVRHRDLRFTWRGFPVDVFVNADTHLPDRVASLRTNPYDIAQHAWGDIRWSTDYLFWKRQPDGFMYPLQWDTSRNGEAITTDSILTLNENPALDRISFTVSDDAQKQYAGNDHLPVDDLPFDAAKQMSSLGKGLWFIAGNWNVLVAEQPDGLVVIECPQAAGYSAKVLAFLQQRFPSEKVKALVSTSDATWHYAGLRTYAARGIPVYALDLTVPLLQAFLAAPHTLSPDEYSRAPRPVDLRAVSDRTVIGAGDSRIELYPIRGEADERMMMAYFPGLQLLYGSSNDVSDRPTGKVGTFNLPELVRAADARGLSVITYVGIHTAALPWQDVVKTAAGPVGH